jgi:hypothetical protein
MIDVGEFYGHLVYFTAISYRYFVVILVYFSRFGMLYQDKSGNRGPETRGSSSGVQSFGCIGSAVCNLITS